MLNWSSWKKIDFGYKVCEKILGTITNKIHNKFLSAMASYWIHFKKSLTPNCTWYLLQMLDTYKNKKRENLLVFNSFLDCCVEIEPSWRILWSWEKMRVPKKRLEGKPPFKAFLSNSKISQNCQQQNICQSRQKHVWVGSLCLLLLIKSNFFQKLPTIHFLHIFCLRLVS